MSRCTSQVVRQQLLFACLLGTMACPVWSLDDFRLRPDTDPVQSTFDLSRRSGYQLVDGFNGKLRFGHQAKFELESERNENLNVNDPEDRRTRLIEYDIAGMYAASDRLHLLGRIDLAHVVSQRQDRSRQTDVELELISLYAQWLLPARSSAVFVGRQELKDRREWLFDEDLDGVGYLWSETGRAAVAFVGREELFKKALRGEHDKEKQNLAYARYYQSVGDRRQASLYGLYVDDRGFRDDERAIFLGARSFGRWRSRTDYWAEAALVFARREGQSSSGFGFDIGVMRERSKAVPRPTLTFALAFGSGGSRIASGGGFRQSGMHGNTQKLGGVVSIDRYGHVFEPELSNMVIMTAGLGMRVTRNWSVDVVWHQYGQVTAADTLRDSNLDADPNGVNRALGSGLDLVVGLRNWNNVSFEAVVGVFSPGSAFGPTASGSRHAELKLRWKIP